MLYYISILIVLAGLLLFQYFAFIRIYYIGEALHKFRELRNEVTLYLSANVKENLSLNEAIAYQQFLLNIDATIKHFNRIKTRFTQFRSVKAIYTNILFSSEMLASSPENTTNLNHYKEKACAGILTAFKAIPFCRARLFVFFF
jgi:hypothetical protein